MSSEKTEYLASEYAVKRIGLFGAYAKGTSISSTSDVDIIVEFDRPIGFKFMELADYLEKKSWGTSREQYTFSLRNP